MTYDQIHNLFKQRYSQTNWKQFLGEAFAKSRLLATPEILTGIDSNVASQVQKLGYITLNENGIERQITVFDVTLEKGIILERNRVGLRNLLRKYWKDIDAAFIAYHRPESPNWRFTYVSELTGYDDDGEYVKIKTEPKRFTYILGEGESTRTIAERFTAISNKGSKATLDDVKEAFSVEKLSSSFFDEYKMQYENFVEYFTGKRLVKKDSKWVEKKTGEPSKQLIYIFNNDEKAVRDFNKKLLGRIVFLYFIQKKGWLGVPAKSVWGKGDFDFLTNLFKNTKNPDLFYSEFLSKLFFDTLNTKRKDDLIELVKGEPCRIPYLNGGLFEEDDRKHRNLIFPANLFKSLFDFFNQYNFTIYEDDPNDHTVAVDPEMLGHIFENLLEDNKDKGAYYTPKEIVHYMCQESLIEYLCTTLKVEPEDQERIAVTKLLKKKEVEEILKPEIKNINKALDSVKICDPAIGSGAFPMGLLHEIFTAKQTLHTFEHGNTKTFDASAVKLNIIQNSIYGVDIEKGAVDIARLRFWLSLIVDEEKPKALPNLDYKIVLGNSLVSKLGDDIIDIDWEVKSTSDSAKKLQTEIQENLNKLFDRQKNYFNYEGDKDKLQKEIRNLKIDLLVSQLNIDKYKYSEKNAASVSLFELTAKEKTVDTERKLKIAGYDRTIRELQKLKDKPDKPLHFFDWKLDFPEVMNEQVADKVGFDIVIANPPYISWYSKQARVLDNKFEKALRGNYKFLEGESPKLRINSAMFFMEKGFDLLKQDAFLIFIQDLNILENPFKPIRKFVTDNFKLNELITGLKAFENVGSGQVIFSGLKTKAFNSCVRIQETMKKSNMIVLEQEKISINDYSWIISSNQALLLRIEDKSKLLETLYESHTGVAVNATEDGKAYFIRDTQVKNSYPFLKGGASVCESFCKPLVDAYLLHDKKMESKLNDEFDIWYFKNKGSHQRPFNLRRLEEYNRPKIFLRQSDVKFTATYTEEFVFGNYSLFNILTSRKRTTNFQQSQ
jgi:adenine-specific DNA-methyltransferase